MPLITTIRSIQGITCGNGRVAVLVKPVRTVPTEHDLKKRTENELAWKVSAQDIAAKSDNLDIKNPHNADAGPNELLAEFARANSKAANVLDELRQELADALGRSS